MPQRSGNHHYWENKATKKEAKSPQFTPLLHIITALSAASARREHHCDFTDLEPYYPSNLQWGIGPLGPKPPKHKGDAQIPRKYRLISNITHPVSPWDLKSKSSTEELKTLESSTTYWEAIERLHFIDLQKYHSYADAYKGGIHQIPWIINVMRQLTKQIKTSS